LKLEINNSLGIGQKLNIEQTQKLVLTTEIIQAIQILGFNTHELNEYVNEALMENPMLDITSDAASHADLHELSHGDENVAPEIKDKSEELDWAEYLSNTSYDDVSYSGYDSGRTAQSADNPYYAEPSGDLDQTLEEALLLQLEFSEASFLIKSIGAYIIQSLDDDGYLRCMASDIAEELGVSEDAVNEALILVQSFEPAGVGARGLCECMLIQLRNQGLTDERMQKIVEGHLEDIAQNRLAAIAKCMKCSIVEVQVISDLIKKLDPRPGRAFRGYSQTRYVVPDVTIEKNNGKYTVKVNDSSAPSLIINQVYRKMLTTAEKESPVDKFLTGRMNSALWLIRSIEQRKETIYNVVEAILKFQMNFFEHGPKFLKPMTLRQIAEAVGVHESTVSRAVRGKYVQSPVGVYELKYFFTSGVSGVGGNGVSSTGVKALIKELIDNENPEAPMSDSAIAQELNVRGVEISRRTIAKYRKEMEIPSSSKRKRF